MPSRPDSMHEQICHWIDSHYPPHSDNHELIIGSNATANMTALHYVEDGFEVGDGFAYSGHERYPCDMISTVTTYFDGRPSNRSGAQVFTFCHENGESFEVLVVSAWVYDSDMHNSLLTLTSVPGEYMAQWVAFEKEVTRIYHSAIPYRGKVYIVGGVDTTFDADVAWDNIYLPQPLKNDILHDIAAFFEKGVSIYQRLNIKPFRKLLFAGVPGTGKTMLCSAIAGWAQERDYFVVYVSGSNQYGAKFWKIHEALEMAASSDAPTIVIVEELDSYLDDESKAQLLNVLDGSESPDNKHGTLLLATTNHPEKIDDRVMKRPGRLDRIFIIPELEDEDTVEEMLRQYLGDVWQDDHAAIVPQLLGRPGAFIREVALYALTMAAYNGRSDLPPSMLDASLETLVNQIEAKDNFLTEHRRGNMGLAADKRRKVRSGFLNNLDE